MCIMRRSAVPLSYRVILVGMIGGAHLISVGHSVFTAFLLLDVVNSNNLTPNRRTISPDKGCFILEQCLQ